MTEQILGKQIEMEIMHQKIEPVIDKFISDHRPVLIPTATVTREQLGIDNQPQPSTSGWHRTRDHRGDDR